MRNLNHLSEVFHSYDTYVIDLWGVMHNGITLNPKAIEVVENLSESSKKIVFLSNVITSGESAMHAINQNKYGKSFYHLGPSRDQ